MKAIKTPNRFFSKNFLDDFSKIAADNFSGDFSYLYDNGTSDKRIIYSSGNTIKFNINFFDAAGEDIPRDADCVIIQNTNAGMAIIKYIDINGDEKDLYTANNNTSKNFIIQIPPDIMPDHRAYGLTIQLLYPFDNSGLIQLRQIRIVKFICDLKATSETQLKPATNEGSLRSFDGKLLHWINYEKWGCSIKAENVPKQQYDLIRDYLRRDGAITLIPYFDWDVDAIYEVYSSRKSIGNYSFSRFSGLVSKTFEFEAV
jgi:hypothetical protein